MLSQSENTHKSSFPSGLFQPKGAYRFSVDALYLAFFAATAVRGTAPPPEPRFVDLGTGCGVVAFAMLRLLDMAHGPIWQGLGIDCQAELVTAAMHNATQLSLTSRYRALQGFVENEHILCEPAPLVVYNPPWRLEGSGLVPPSLLRRKALFGHKDTFDIFAKAAARYAKPGGCVCTVVGNDRVDDQLVALTSAGLTPQLVLPIQTRPEVATFTLIEAKKAL